MQAVIRKYIGFQTFFNLLLWIPIFYEFQKRMGLSDPEIFGIQSIYYVAFCLLEVPTGFLADRFGYKRCLAVGAALLAGANLLPIASPGYAGFLGHFLLIALSRSLISGASSAYLYEYLKSRDASDLYKKVEGDARFYSLIARVAAWGAVGYLMAYEVTLPYWISAVNAGLAFLLAASLPALVTAGIGPAQKAATFKANAQAAFGEVARSPLLLLLMLQGVGLFVMVRIVQVNLYQPVLKDKLFTVESFGWIMAAMTVFEAIGSRQSHRLKSLVADRSAVTTLTLLLGATLVALAWGNQAVTMAALCIFSLATGLAFPIQKQLLNDAITQSRLRATLLSMESIVDRAVCAVAVLPLGALVAAGMLSWTLAASGLATGVAALVVHAFMRQLDRSGRRPAPGAMDKTAAS